MRRLQLLLTVGLTVAATGCLYTRGSLGHDRRGYHDYPTSVAAEHARRGRRRQQALIAAPLEVIAGVGLTALALYAPITRSDSESVTDALGDAASEIAGRVVAVSVGGALVISGIGDGVLGLSDAAFPSPLVRDGALVSADQIDTIAPASGPRLNLHASQLASTRGVGSDGGLGLAHWIGPRLRVREAVSGEWSLGFRDHAVRYALAGDVTVERAFGREHAGLYPRTSIGVYGGGAWTRIAGHDRGVVRAGLATTLRKLQVRLGASYLPGVDRLPAVELSFRRELQVD